MPIPAAPGPDFLTPSFGLAAPFFNGLLCGSPIEILSIEVLKSIEAEQRSQDLDPDRVQAWTPEGLEKKENEGLQNT